jgi:hypothetical protein
MLVVMTSSPTDTLIDRGETLLRQTDYLAAERVLAEVESIAWKGRDYVTLERVYRPLQEVRRQRRQRCGEGVVRLDFLATAANEVIEPAAIAGMISHGQVLVAGFGDAAPALTLRQFAISHGLYLDVFLACVIPDASRPRLAILPFADPNKTRFAGAGNLPPFSVLTDPRTLPTGAMPGSDQTYATTMALWEQLHRPWLDEADGIADPLLRLTAYRNIIGIDYACEPAHQKLARLARDIHRGQA